MLDIDHFKRKISNIYQMGFIETHRTGDTGIGKTLEDLLDITENNIAGPDFDIYELKSARKNTSSMLTLFTKVPQPRGANKILLENIGYKQRKSLSIISNSLSNLKINQNTIHDLELHVTVDSLKYNSVGLKLEFRNQILYLSNEKKIEVYYERDYLNEAFEKKYRHKLLYVLAENKKERGKPEEFWFNEAYLLDDFNFQNFVQLVHNGKIKLDIRIGHYPNGRPHDHGTGFRVFPKDLPLCFKKIEKIL